MASRISSLLTSVGCRNVVDGPLMKIMRQWIEMIDKVGVGEEEVASKKINMKPNELEDVWNGLYSLIEEYSQVF
jgi:hypothetical protein